MRAGDAGEDGASLVPGPVAVMAPFGRDEAVLCRTLSTAKIACMVCTRDEAALLAELLENKVDALLLTQEALGPNLMSRLIEFFPEQPAWSDLPIIVLMGGTLATSASEQEVTRLRSAGNITVLERPVRSLTLITTIEAALRARRRQHEIRALMEREQQARMDAEAASRVKDDFLAMVSHDLRTPLGSILLWTQFLLEQRVDTEMAQHALEVIHRSAQAQSKLIENLLDATRIRSGKFKLERQHLDFAALARAAIDLVQAQAQAKAIELTSDVEDDIPVSADATRLQQVLWNLLSNAIAFTPSGGRVHLRVSRRARWACVEVSDTGIGIQKELLPYVFDRFRQAETTSSGKRGGLGLGLAISRDLILLHGGTINAESPGEGGGAVFRIDLPLAVDEATLHSPSPETQLRRRLEGIRVMLVEDDDDTREAMLYSLEHEGARVAAVDSADAALTALQAMSPDDGPDVLLTDLRLPGMDGAQLLHEIRAREQNLGADPVPAALFTAETGRQDRAQLASDLGFSTCLSKPVDPQRLAATVERLASAHRPK